MCPQSIDHVRVLRRNFPAQHQIGGKKFRILSIHPALERIEEDKHKHNYVKMNIARVMCCSYRHMFRFTHRQFPGTMFEGGVRSDITAVSPIVRISKTSMTH